MGEVSAKLKLSASYFAKANFIGFFQKVSLNLPKK